MSQNIHTSSELQEVVLSSILKDSYILSKIKNDIKISFFDKLSYKLIYKCLLYYYNRYARMPTLQSLLIVLDDLYVTDYGDKDEIKNDLIKLYNQSISSDEFIIDQITKFIKRRRIEETLSSYLPKIKNGDSISIDELGDELSNNISIDLRKSEAFRLSDYSKFSEVRKESIGVESDPLIIKSAFPAINNSLMYKGYKVGDVVVVVARPGNGKTMMMVNELSHASILGFNVLHVFLGDMTKLDGFIRYASNISKVPQDEIVMMNESEQIDLIKKCNYQGYFDRISVDAYAASEISIDELIENIFKAQDELKVHYDMIAIDYPDNLLRENDSMYESGGVIYNKLSYLARRNRCVVIVGSQPKQEYWNSEIIPLNGCAESSKKQQIIDVMICLGKPNNDVKLLSGFLAKIRRGEVGTIFRIKTEFEKAYMSQISEYEYLNIKSGNEE